MTAPHGAAGPHPLHALRSGRPRRAPAPGGSPARGLDALLADLDTGAVPVPTGRVPGTAVREGFSWAAHDADDARWYPQGVACLRGGAVLLVGWYEKPAGLLGRSSSSGSSSRSGRRWLPRSRVSVVDRSDPTRPRYRHVELVVPHRRPLAWVRALGPVPVHAGGLAVVDRAEGGPLLLVADTLAGLRTFALDDLAPGPDGWVLPQRASLRAPLLRGALADLRARRRPNPLRFSFVGAAAGGRGGGGGGAGGGGSDPELVVGEYRRAGDRRPDGPPRLLRYRLDPRTGLPAAAPGARGGEPLEVHVGQPPRMQGAALLPSGGGGDEDGVTWVLSASAGHERCGDLHVGSPGAWTTHRGALPPGCEDLDPEDPGDPASHLWGASEHPGRRWVYRVEVPVGGRS
ncbi:hypothetical protein [Quadrisphaera sp. INWT6]|uniref:hypothetical protein n=1 Tax=Quadrisphaera sp. INWT6 TaxID=2596917 RepID=UPI0018924A16|nr:hypothetical protein [Quadrisphaera sp. INWT6]MBF5082435.1 hypothetical protein [Quadrisphaera sp. INWT6]